MISFRADARAKNLAGIDRRKKLFQKLLNDQFRYKVYAMYRDLNRVSPQFSGDYVSNWELVTSSTSPRGYQEWKNKGSVLVSQQPKHAGDSDAVDFSLRRMYRVKLDYRDKVYFYNPTPVEFTATTATGPDGKTTALRPENILSPPQLLFSYLKANYGK